jgi:hypothetical protein
MYGLPLHGDDRHRARGSPSLERRGDAPVDPGCRSSPSPECTHLSRRQSGIQPSWDSAGVGTSAPPAAPTAISM